MYGRIFTPTEWVNMATATGRLSNLQFEAVGRLTNTLVKIGSIGDPYYMDLQPATYLAALSSEAGH